MTRLNKTILMLTGALLIFGLNGCIFSPDDNGDGGGGVVTPKYDWPESKEILMQNFRDAYSAMDLDGYIDMLHDDYQFIYKDLDGTIGTLYYNDEKIIATNMFSGDPRTNPNTGELQGGISAIDIKKLDITEWSEIQEGDREFGMFENAWEGRFLTEIVFTYDDPNTGSPSTYTVDGVQSFIVAPFLAERNNIMVDKWKIVGQKDRASGA
jgi:hypothetical protein